MPFGKEAKHEPSAKGFVRQVPNLSKFRLSSMRSRENFELVFVSFVHNLESLLMISLSQALIVCILAPV